MFLPGPALSGYIAWAKTPMLEWALCQPAEHRRKGLWLSTVLESIFEWQLRAPHRRSLAPAEALPSLVVVHNALNQDWDAARMDPRPGSALIVQLQHRVWISPEFQGMSAVTFCLLINELPVSLHIFKGRYPEAGSHSVSSWYWRGAHVGRLWRNHKSFARGGLNWTSSCSTQRVSAGPLRRRELGQEHQC